MLGLKIGLHHKQPREVSGQKAHLTISTSAPSIPSKNSYALPSPAFLTSTRTIGGQDRSSNMAPNDAPRVEDYTIAWVCSMAVEAVASMEMLDESHPYLPSGYAKDNNSYTLGKIGEHNVVIVTSTAGAWSTCTHASLISDTLRVFPGISLCLSIGIGAGVWSSTHDIRLGDVVVSCPSGKLPAVIQLDLGKDVPHSEYSLSNPLFHVTMNEMALLQSRHRFEEPALLNYLAELQITQPLFRQPKGEEDRLFEAAYPHQGGSNDCSACDLSRILQRPRRDTEDPIIHYGPIASMNQVLKSGELREQLCQKFPDILCFENEEVGISAPLPCLLVRGICDYADSHKNKQWQSFAAAAAAAYAKELLSVIPYSDSTLAIRSRTKTLAGALASPIGCLLICWTSHHI
jgi:nucleoside phosphorylase